MNTRRWDIFCKVIDNFGDIGFCWRLARQLSNRYAQTVRLFVDDLQSFSRIEPNIQHEKQSQYVENIEIIHWSNLTHCDETPADIVIEAFACGLEERRLAAWKRSNRPPIWVNLEYLSAENWVESCHLMRSMHPRFGLEQFFFFGGFTAKTGGLLAPKPFSGGQFSNLAPQIAQHSLQISLFSYETPALFQWFELWKDSPTPILVHIPNDRALKFIKENKTYTSININSPKTFGSLTLAPRAWVRQDEYDELLKSCDINIVRGEDSFVRAQWAAKPMFWHIYPTEDKAHLQKLNAFSQQYTRILSPEHATIWCDISSALNEEKTFSDQSIKHLWQAFFQALPKFQTHAHHWHEHCSALGDLTKNLIDFCESKIFSAH